MAFLKRSRFAGWRKGPPKGGEIPANFISDERHRNLHDESGDFGPFSEHCPYYVVTMVFHEQIERLYDRMKELEYRLQVLGLEDHCIHSSPAIRGEDEYYGMDLALRRKVIANLMAFISHGAFKYKCFFARKTEGSTEQSVVTELREQIDPFVTYSRGKGVADPVTAFTSRGSCLYDEANCPST